MICRQTLDSDEDMVPLKSLGFNYSDEAGIVLTAEHSL